MFSVPANGKLKMTERKLTPKQHVFVTAYLETGSANEAYRRAYDVSRMLPATIASRASDQLRNGLIAAKIDELQNEAANAAVMDRAATIRLITEIATADASQLSEIQIRNCRHCWGLNHAYHWVNDVEYAYRCAEVTDANARALERWEAMVASGRRVDRPVDTPIPSDAGGYGFNVSADPNPGCPKCLGDGIETVRFKDTRRLKGAAKRLFAGIKKTKDGIEIKTRSQDKALGLLAAIHGIKESTAPQVAMQVNAPGGTVQTAVVMPSDPLDAARAYQELMKS